MIGALTVGQTVVKGTITGKDGNGIPGVRVAVENTTYGVPSSNNGGYFLEVDKSETLIIKYQMIGFATHVDTLILTAKITDNNVILYEESKSLNTVEIYADKRDIAKEVIGKVIDNKKNIRNQFESYECNTYIKTSLEGESRNASDFTITVGGNKNDTTVQEPKEPIDKIKKMNFIESNSITQFKRRNTYKETILAHHDYAEKSNSSVVVTTDFSNPNSILPSQVIAYNPYIFFEKTQDGDFDLYQNLIDLPKVSSDPFVSPLALNAFINYKFTLNAVFIEGEQKIYDIIVEPRFKETALFSGNLYIIDSLWIVKSMDLSVNPSALTFFKDFRIIQDYDQIDGKWVVDRREFIYTIKDGPYMVMANTRVNHTDYKFDLDFDRKTFKNVVMTYDEEAFNKDSAYWANVRPIQLKPEELAFIHEQDSMQKVLESDEYIDLSLIHISEPTRPY